MFIVTKSRQQVAGGCLNALCDEDIGRGGREHLPRVGCRGGAKPSIKWKFGHGRFTGISIGTGSSIRLDLLPLKVMEDSVCRKEFRFDLVLLIVVVVVGCRKIVSCLSSELGE